MKLKLKSYMWGLRDSVDYGSYGTYCLFLRVDQPREQETFLCELVLWIQERSSQTDTIDHLWQRMNWAVSQEPGAAGGGRTWVWKDIVSFEKGIGGGSWSFPRQNQKHIHANMADPLKRTNLHSIKKLTLKMCLHQQDRVWFSPTGHLSSL